jgi:hypothetical protein
LDAFSFSAIVSVIAIMAKHERGPSSLIISKRKECCVCKKRNIKLYLHRGVIFTTPATNSPWIYRTDLDQSNVDEKVF